MDAIIAGVDEAGRGPLAGPVYAAAVILHGVQIEGLNDSKKLSERKRELLFDQIINKAVAYGIAWATPEEIAEWAYFLTITNTFCTGQNILVDGGESINYHFVWKD